MTEHNLKDTYEPRSLDEVVGEVEIKDSLPKFRNYDRLIYITRQNALALVAGIVIGMLFKKIDTFELPKEVFASAVAVGGPTLDYLIKKNPTIYWEMPGWFLGATIGQYISQRYL